MARKVVINKLVTKVEADSSDFEKNLLASEKAAKEFAREEKKAMLIAERAAKQFAREQKKSMAAANRAMKDLSSKTISGMKTAGKAVLAMAATTGAALTALFVSTSSYAGLLGETADKLGIATQAMEGLRYAAELTGVKTTALDIGLQRMTRRLAEVETTGGGQAKKVLDQLGISIDDLSDKSVDEQFKSIADAFQDIDKQSEKVLHAFGLFDTEGVNLVLTMEGGAAAIQAAQDEAIKLGIALDRADVAKFEAAGDAMTRMQAALRGAGNIISVELAPYVEALATEFADAAVEASGFSATVSSAMSSSIKAVAYMANVTYGLGLGWAAIKTYPLEFADTFMQSLVSMSKAQNTFRESFAGKLVHGFSIDEEEVVKQKAAHEAVLKKAKEVGEKLAKAQKDVLEREEAGAPGKRIIERAKQIAMDAQIAADKVADEREKNRTIKNKKNKDIFIATTQAQINAEVELFKNKSEQVMAVRMQEDERFVDLETFRHERALATAQKEYDDLLEKGVKKEEIEAEHYARFEAENAAHLKRLDRAREQEDRNVAAAAKFKTMSFQNQTVSVLGSLTSLTSGAAQNSKKMFKINKTLGIASALVSTATGVAKTLATYPWPLAGVMAAAHLVAGMAQVSAIRSTTYAGGGSGTTPSSAGSTPVINDVPVPQLIQQDQAGQTQPQINVFIEGFGELDGDAIMDLIEDRFKNRDQIVISAGTAQAEELRRAA